MVLLFKFEFELLYCLPLVTLQSYNSFGTRVVVIVTRYKLEAQHKHPTEC